MVRWGQHPLVIVKFASLQIILVSKLSTACPQLVFHILQTIRKIVCQFQLDLVMTNELYCNTCGRSGYYASADNLSQCVVYSMYKLFYKYLHAVTFELCGDLIICHSVSILSKTSLSTLWVTKWAWAIYWEAHPEDVIGFPLSIFQHWVWNGSQGQSDNSQSLSIPAS